MKTAAVLSAAVVVGFVPCCAADAASFSCAKAATDQERLICATPELSKLDEQMAAQFRANLAKVSPEGQKALRASQQSWLAFARVVCEVDYSSGEDAIRVEEASVACLQLTYKRRIAFLARAVFQGGPYRFIQIDRFFAAKSDDAARWDYRGFATWHETFPEIDAPRNGTTAQWNAVHALHGKLEPDPEYQLADNRYSVEVMLATAGLISARKVFISASDRVSTVSKSGSSMIMTASGMRKLTSADLFKEGSSWAKGIASDLFGNCIGWGQKYSVPQDLVTEVEEEVSSLKSLVLTKRGVEVDYVVDTGFTRPPVCHVELSWLQLRPYLIRYPFL